MCVRGAFVCFCLCVCVCICVYFCVCLFLCLKRKFLFIVVFKAQKGRFDFVDFRRTIRKNPISALLALLRLYSILDIF